MKQKSVVFFCLVSLCSAKELFIETCIENRFSPDYFDEYGTVLQGPSLSVHYLFEKPFMLGIGVGPFMMNGFVPSNDSMSASMQSTFNFWGDFFFVAPLKMTNTLICFGGKLGKMTDNYSLDYDIAGNSSAVIPNYSVTDTYFASVGSKVTAGFKHFRLALNGFWNLGIRNEPFGFNAGSEEWGPRKTIISCLQFDAGVTVAIPAPIPAVSEN